MSIGRQQLSVCLPFVHPITKAFPVTDPAGIETIERHRPDMLHRFAAAAAVCMLVPMGVAPLALADPPADNAAPPPPGGPGLAPVPSGPPGTLKTPDGWNLSVTAKDES